MKAKSLQLGDTIGVIAPSRPIYPYQEEIYQGIENLKKLGFRVKLGKNLEQKLYYSAGTPEQKASDINEMFRDNEVKAIICATGGSSSNQILELIDFNLIKENPKIFLGYSDITTLLLAIYKKTGLITFHGPDVYEFFHISEKAQDFFLNLTAGKMDTYSYPKEITALKPGKTEGALLGGNILIMNALIGSEYFPTFDNAILFWEAVNLSPAMIDFRLNGLKIAGIMDKISGMIIGYLSECNDKKYPEDNRSINEIVLEITKRYNFPIIQVDYFGHDIANFYTFPIGINAKIDTEKLTFEILDSPVLK
jgi:muramoyltetrapeptide carboxypeptidase